MDANQRFAELAGLHWHENVGFVNFKGIGIKHICHKCGMTVPFINYNPDFTDAREVLRVMMEREDANEFWDYIFLGRPIVDLILDTTGKLRDMAIEWMEGEHD